MFSAHDKFDRNGPKWGREVVFPTNPDLADILGRTDFYFENYYSLDLFASQMSRFPDCKILDFPSSGFLDWQISTWPAGWGRGTAPRQLRTTKLVRSKELGQYHRENPISASPVWGILHCCHTSNLGRKIDNKQTCLFQCVLLLVISLNRYWVKVQQW